MSAHDVLDAQYRHYLSSHNVISYGGAATIVCPLCKDDHIICQFAAGSLGCVAVPCLNPHHRNRP